MKPFFLTWGLVFLAALFDSYASLIVKMKFNELGHIDFSSLRSFFQYILKFVKSPILLSAIITFAAAPALWFLALNRLDLSIGYPVLVAFHLVFILAFGILFLNEGMTINKAIGTVLLMISIYLFYKK